MANKYQGFVEFTDSEGQTFVLRLSTFQYVEANKTLSEEMHAREFQIRIFHLALVHGAVAPGHEAQKDLTLEEAGDILDDIGYIQANDLIDKTKFGSNVKRTQELERQRQQDAQITAAETLAKKIVTLRKGVTDEKVLDALDRVVAVIDEMSKVKAPAVNPIGAATIQ